LLQFVFYFFFSYSVFQHIKAIITAEEVSQLFILQYFYLSRAGLENMNKNIMKLVSGTRFNSFYFRVVIIENLTFDWGLLSEHFILLLYLMSWLIWGWIEFLFLLSSSLNKMGRKTVNDLLASFSLLKVVALVQEYTLHDLRKNIPYMACTRISQHRTFSHISRILQRQSQLAH